MWETWQGLDLDKKLTVLAVFIPLASGVLSALMGFVGYLITRKIERRAVRETLSEEILKFDRFQKKAEVLEKLKDYPPWAVEMLRQDILDLYGEEVRFEWDSMQCVVTAVERTVRAEGISELMGDISLQFSAGKVDSEPDRFDVEISFNVNVTNSVAGDGTVDAVLLERVESGLESVSKGAVLEATNKLRFQGVGIQPPAKGKVRQLVIRSVRLNVSEVGGLVEAEAKPLEEKSSSEILAFVAIKPSRRGGGSVYMANELVVLANPIPGSLVEVRGPNDDRLELPSERDAYRNMALLATPSSARYDATLNLCFTERFERAFTAVAEETASTCEEAWTATTGVRFLAMFWHIPDGVSVFVTARDVEAGTTRHSQAPKAVWVSGANLNGAGGQVTQPDDVSAEVPRLRNGVPIYPVPVNGGFGWAVWEWVSLDTGSPQSIEKVSFGIVLAADPNRPPSPACGHVDGTLAPISTIVTASESAPIPRFVNLAGHPQPFLIVHDNEQGSDNESQGTT